MPRSRVRNQDAARFGEIVNALRVKRGWTLADVARASGMHATYLGLLERGENVPTLTTILRLARTFGISAADLLREVERAAEEAAARAARLG